MLNWFTKMFGRRLRGDCYWLPGWKYLDGIVTSIPDKNAEVGLRSMSWGQLH